MKQRDVIIAIEKLAHTLETAEASGEGRARDLIKGDEMEARRERAFFMVGWLGHSTKDAAHEFRLLVARMKSKPSRS